MSPEVRAAMTANANQALKQYADPETRRGLIDYYRSIGIELDENAWSGSTVLVAVEPRRRR